MEDKQKKPAEKKTEEKPLEKPVNESPACPYCDAGRDVCPLCTANMSVEDDE